MMVSGEDEGLVCEENMDRNQFEYVSDLGFVFDESGMDGECCKKVVSGRKVACVMRLLVNISSLSLVCGSVLCEGLLVLVLIYGSETMV